MALKKKKKKKKVHDKFSTFYYREIKKVWTFYMHHIFRIFDGIDDKSKKCILMHFDGVSIHFYTFSMVCRKNIEIPSNNIESFLCFFDGMSKKYRNTIEQHFNVVRWYFNGMSKKFISIVYRKNIKISLKLYRITSNLNQNFDNLTDSR